MSTLDLLLDSSNLGRVGDTPALGLLRLSNVVQAVVELLVLSVKLQSEVTSLRCLLWLVNARDS